MDTDRRFRLVWSAAFVAVAVGAGALAFALGGGEGYWIDEVSSIDIARRALDRGVPYLVGWTTYADVHPPGYYVLLAGWSGLFGVGEAATRALSALLAAGAVWGTARLGARCFGPTVGLAAAAMLALLPATAHYAVEVRSQALVLALSVGAVNAALSVLDGRRGAAWLLGAALACGLWADYAFAPVAAALVGAALFAGAADVRAATRLVAATAIALALFAPWIPALLFQMLDLPAGFTAHVAAGPGLADLLAALGPAAGFEAPALARGGGILWAAAALCGGVVTAFGLPRRAAPSAELPADGAAVPLSGGRPGRWPVLGLLGGVLLLSFFGPPLLLGLVPSAHFIDRLTGYVWIALLVPVAGLAAAGALAWSGLRFGPRRRSPARVVGIALLALAVVVFALDAVRPYLLARTALPLLPFAAVAVAGGLSRVGGWRGLALGTALVVVTGTSSLPGPDRVAPRPDLRTTAAALREAPALGHPVAVLPTWEVSGLAHYAPDADLRGVLDLAEVPDVVRGQPVATVVFARREAERHDALRESLLGMLGDAVGVCGEGAARGFRWLTLCRR